MSETRPAYAPAEPLSPPVAPRCPKCGASDKIPRDWLVCIGCALDLDPEALAKVRDALAEHLETEQGWLDRAQAVLERMGPEHRDYPRARAIWDARFEATLPTRRNHRALCWATAVEVAG